MKRKVFAPVVGCVLAIALVQGQTPAQSNDVPMVPGDTSGMGSTP